MNVEVINVGTELLLGEIINTEAPVLFKMCKELGFVFITRRLWVTTHNVY